ncbi:uncharacterized protein LOC122264009 [Penaeus japonicus]|uniref:uncharacterized protein LOC122264009 n=1 Tax=Penaeus japonicus TaxID=27405 RepID=UPI001C7121B0|nr:uncharacterized protein LOC122264009 [Penaeus japonicus]XP_042888565.1 uncharacterized protein LOC122264009 [Penaeus japonicus]
MGEQKCVLNSCCCGCSLRSGSLAIGIVGLVLSVIAAIYSIIRGVNGDTQGWIDMAVQLIEVVICIILIQGIRTDHRGMVMVWVWVSAIMIAINIVLVIIGIILTLNIIFAIIAFIVFGVAVYCILVVRSYALTLGGSGSVA